MATLEVERDPAQLRPAIQALTTLSEDGDAQVVADGSPPFRNCPAEAGESRAGAEDDTHVEGGFHGNTFDIDGFVEGELGDGNREAGPSPEPTWVGRS